jgi:hypothetical protein
LDARCNSNTAIVTEYDMWLILRIVCVSHNRDLGEAYRCGVTTATSVSGGHIHSTSIGNGDKGNDDNVAVSAAMASVNAQQVKTSDIYNQVR